MAQRSPFSGVQLHTLFHPLGVFARQGSRPIGILWQHLQKGLHARSIVFEVRRELPQNWPQLVAKIEKSRGEEIRERLSHLLQPSDVRDVARSLDGELEVLWGLLAPFRIAFRALQRIKRAIDLDRWQQARRIVQLETLR